MALLMSVVETDHNKFERATLCKFLAKGTFKGYLEHKSATITLSVRSILHPHITRFFND